VVEKLRGGLGYQGIPVRFSGPNSVATSRYSRMASAMFASASASVVWGPLREGVDRHLAARTDLNIQLMAVQ
jgi:hypothetical protein